MMSLILFTLYGAQMYGTTADLVPRGLSSVPVEAKAVEAKAVKAKEEVKQPKAGCSSCSCGK